MPMFREYLGFKPTMAGFATQLLLAFANDEAGGWSFDASDEVLRHSSGSQINLRNMFLEYCASERSGRSALIRKYADLSNGGSARIPSLWVAAAKHIYPVVRSRFVETTVEIERRMKPQPSGPAVTIPLTGDLQIRFVYDFGNYLSYVKEEHLSTWGQSLSEIRERATANLAKLDEPEWVDSQMGFFQLASSMSFAESMLLLDRIVDKLPFKDSAVVLPCNRGVLLAADGLSDTAMQAMLTTAILYHEQEPWPMTATLCTRVEGRWQEFSPSGDTARLARNLFVVDRAAFYAGQKESLDKFHEQTGKAVFTATFSIRVLDDIYESTSVWTQGVMSLLPVTDWIALSPLDDAVKFKHVRWQAVLDVCGHRMQPTNESPQRFLVETFPDAGEWVCLVDERTE